MTVGHGLGASQKRRVLVLADLFLLFSIPKPCWWMILVKHVDEVANAACDCSASAIKVLCHAFWSSKHSLCCLHDRPPHHILGGCVAAAQDSTLVLPLHLGHNMKVWVYHKCPQGFPMYIT